MSQLDYQLQVALMRPTWAHGGFETALGNFHADVAGIVHAKTPKSTRSRSLSRRYGLELSYRPRETGCGDQA